MVLTGGNENIVDLSLTLKQDVEVLNQQKGVNFQVVKSNIDSQYQAWIGGALISKLPFAYLYQITKTEY